jgi:ankyrin repeat protein
MASLNAARFVFAILACAVAGQATDSRQDMSVHAPAAAQAEAMVTAARDNDTDLITRLISQGLDVNIRSARGVTPLMSAAAAGSIDAARLLLGAGADVNVRAPYGKTALSMTIEYFTPNHNDDNEHGFFMVVKELIAAGADINSREDNGLTPLLWAAAAGNAEFAKDLITAGAKVNLRSRVEIEKGRHLTVTPLIYSVISCTDQTGGYLATIRLLLASGADPRARDSHGRTALQWAVAMELTEVSSALREGAPKQRPGSQD